MNYLVCQSYALLVYVDLTLRSKGLERLYDSLRNRLTNNVPATGRVPYGRLCRAVDLACVFYPKTVFCLQRSAAGVLLLRRYGWPAEFVTGSDFGTFESHAWLELDGQVINDKTYLHEMYEVLDRC